MVINFFCRHEVDGSPDKKHSKKYSVSPQASPILKRSQKVHDNEEFYLKSFDECEMVINAADKKTKCVKLSKVAVATLLRSFWAKW